MASRYAEVELRRNALFWCERNVEIAEELWGRTGRRTAKLRYLLGAAYLSAGQRSKSVTVLKRAVHDLELIHGPHNVEALEASRSLALALYFTGSVSRARSELERVRDVALREPGGAKLAEAAREDLLLVVSTTKPQSADTEDP